jgi:DNA-binding PadR family transcriptional regulator
MEPPAIPSTAVLLSAVLTRISRSCNKRMPRRTIRTKHREQKAAEASARAEAKALELGANGWTPSEGTGILLTTLRRLERRGQVELRASTNSEGRIDLHFRAV